MYRLVLALFENDGSSYAFKQIIFASSKSYTGFNNSATNTGYTSGVQRTNSNDWDISDDMTVAVVYYTHRTVYGSASTVPNNYHTDILIGTPGETYTDISSKYTSGDKYYCTNVAVSPKGSYVVTPALDLTGYFYVYKVNKETQAVTNMTSTSTNASYKGYKYHLFSGGLTSNRTLVHMTATEKAFYYVYGDITSGSTTSAYIKSVPIDVDTGTFDYLGTSMVLQDTGTAQTKYQYPSISSSISSGNNLLCNISFDFVNELIFVCVLSCCAVRKLTMSANGVITGTTYASQIDSYGLNTQYGNAIVVPNA
jgi:hypothetical protein